METRQIIGRERECDLLTRICDEREARLVALYGRRRVGKTYLVKNYFEEKFDFFFTGSFETPVQIQLSLFRDALCQYAGKQFDMPKNWNQAFAMLRDYLSQIKKERIVVFFDELPWMDSPKSNFLSAFSYFWNSWASTLDGLKLIICGSATSWMIDKIIGDKGGLYGRVSHTIYIAPFNLHEVEMFLQKRKGILWNRYQILQAYMIFGGIPYYLDMLDKSATFAENIDQLFFKNQAPLRTEYEFLFRSLFKSSNIYRQVVEAVAKKNKGLTLSEIKTALKIGDGGKLSTVLKNLCSCDFLRKYSEYGKKEKNSVYQLTDLYSLFYLKFVVGKNGRDEHFWSNVSDNVRNSWAGYAFEQVCLHHISQIRSKLGIQGVLTDVCTWSIERKTDCDGTEWPGTQIDLLLCRGDHIINVCEMKYSQSEYVVSREYEEHLRERNNTFAHFTKTKDALHTVLVTTYGLKKNAFSDSIYATISADDLFEK